MSLIDNIREKAAELGLGKIGAIRPEALDGYVIKLDEREQKVPLGESVYGNFRKLARPKDIFPELKSIIVTSFFMGHYRLPKPLINLIGRHYLVDLRNNPLSPEKIKVSEFSKFLQQSGLSIFQDDIHGVAPMRWAAKEAGLGRIRKNNFFYTENGSWNAIYAWLTDKDMEWIETVNIPKCPEKCRKCVDSCPTGSLSEAFTMNMTTCVSYLTALNPVVIEDEGINEALGPWLYGCDACQDVCPFNKGKWREEDEFPELTEIAEEVLPERLLSMEISEIKRLISPKFFYIKDENLYKWKINAINVIVNTKRKDLTGALILAGKDPHPAVSGKALWALDKLRARESSPELSFAKTQ
jgi:epoxyqueuosine reductase